MSENAQITQVLDAVARGEAGAAQDLLPLVYEELRRLAGARMAHEAAGHTLQATALVHEAWLRLGRVQKLIPRSPWKEGVVPLGQVRVAEQVEFPHLLGGDWEVGWVMLGV